MSIGFDIIFDGELLGAQNKLMAVTGAALFTVVVMSATSETRASS